jgi:hypothetical protein
LRNNIILDINSVENNNSSERKKIIFCVRRMCKIFNWGVMMHLNIAYLEGPLETHFDHDIPNNFL